ncbi:hypothetical protein PC116_g16856 [Phytophthora cactorum]|nr:hypothetical protein C6341_g8615 [Phytophthora cactorum]KAG3200396.1 hypothetical protein PC128_g4638 [Phytophthora cactorum]KAG4235005.1 hypothetical protein PC116_g16856 [Phytophthora cactorum]
METASVLAVDYSDGGAFVASSSPSVPPGDPCVAILDCRRRSTHGKPRQ